MYEYDKADNPLKVTYPAGKVVEYTYDAQDNAKTIKVNTVALTNYTYDVLSRRTIKDLVVGAVTQRATTAYNIGDQITSVTNTIQGYFMNSNTMKYIIDIFDFHGIF